MRKFRWPILAALLFVPPTSLPAQRVSAEADLADLEMAVGVDPYDAAAHYNLAIGYWGAKRYDDVERELDRALELDPRFAPACLARAFLPFARHPELWDEFTRREIEPEWREMLVESDRWYRRAFLIDPMVDVRILAAVTPGRHAAWSASDELAAFYRDWFQGYDDFELGDYEAAFFRFDRMIRELKRSRIVRSPHELLFLRGIAALHVEKYDQAVRDFEYLMETERARGEGDEIVREPLRENEYRYMLAFARERQGKLKEAKGLYHEALVRDIGLFTAHVRLAEIHEREGDFEAALAERRRAVDASPDDPSLLTDLAVALAKRERWTEAYEVVEQANVGNPDDPRPWYFRSLLALKVGDTQDAKRCLDEFLRRAPSRFGPQIKEARNYRAALR